MNNYKYLSLVEWAKMYISENRLSEGDRFLSENELAILHNVSRQTVRQALNVLEKQDVISRTRGSGTYVKFSGNAELPRHINVGLVSTYFSDYIFPSIVTGIEKVLHKNGVGMQLAITHNKVYEESQALNNMIEQGVQGLIVEPSKSALPNQNIQLYEEIRNRNIPLVFFNARYSWADFPLVSMDDVAAGKLAADTLFEKGHRKLIAIFAVDDIQGHLRYKGFMESCIEKGITRAEENVMWYTTFEAKTLFSVFESRMLKLIRKAEATAVVCYNDSLAHDLENFCKSHGIDVPNDLSIVSIDDSKLAELCDVPLTTVRHPNQLLGEKAADMILEMIRNPGMKFDDVIFTPEIRMRDSIAELK